MRHPSRGYRILEVLASIRPDIDEAERLLDAAHCLLFDICHAIGEDDVAVTLRESWAGKLRQEM
jgi:hypothetical protein